MAVTVRTDYSLRLVNDPPVANWQDAYDIAYTTGDFGPADTWYDANVGRTSTAELLDLGGQVAVTSSWLTTNASANPDHVGTEDGRWVVQDVKCSNFRITSLASGLPITLRQNRVEQGAFSVLYGIHTPTTVTPIHDVRIYNNDIIGNNNENFAVYFPTMDAVAHDLHVYRNNITGWRGGCGGVRGVTFEENLVHSLTYTEESHNTAASFRGSQCRAIRNRVRPGVNGVSGINFYAEVGDYDPDVGDGLVLCYNHLYLIENMIHADQATATINFPEGDGVGGDGSVIYDQPLDGQTRQARGNIIDRRFSNPYLWCRPGQAVGSIVDGSGIADNIHWDGSDADDGSLP